MFKLWRGALLFPALLFAPLFLHAQTVAVAPTTATVYPGGTIQFTKSTNMLSPETVTWSVAGIPNGNSGVGTVSPTGLYTAPSGAPTQNPVTVTATSTANSALSASATVTISTAPAITVSPSYAQLGVNQTVQFSVTVKNLASTDVTWSLAPAGMAVGSITAAGLYTAPAAIPAQNPITVKATSKLDNTTVGVGYAYLLKNGPTITAVSPNPIPVGTLSITITGSGFATGAMAMVGGVQYGPSSLTANSLTTTIYQGPATSTTICVRNPDSVCSNSLVIPVSGSTSGGGSGSGSGSGGGSTPTPAPVVAPATATVPLGATQQFTASNVTTWTATLGTITSAGLYTAPAQMPATTTATITATGPGGAGKATVTLIPNTPPQITGITPIALPLGVFTATINGTGFIAQSVAALNGKPLATTLNNGALTISGFAGSAGQYNLTVANGPLTSPQFPVQVGVPNPQVSASAARRFLEQAAFGPTPQDADHVQAVGFQGWLNEQFNMPQVSNYDAAGNQGGMPSIFLANAVTNSDQLRQKVAFALSQIFVTSLNKLIWNSFMVPYQDMLLADSFTNYRKILGDVTLSPAMGYYLDMGNNAKANPAAGTVANENYGREVLQLFSIGTALLNQDGTPIMDNTLTPPQPKPAYDQFAITEFARAFTGWTYAPPPGKSLQWNAYPNNTTSPMQPFPSMHDSGPKTLLNGVTTPNFGTPQGDLQIALDNIAGHPNTAPFISKLLIQHLVKSNPTPAYVQRVATTFTQTQGDMKAVVTAILLDSEARANDEGGADQPNDGHLQEPALFISGIVRAFGGLMNAQNYFAYNMASQGQDLFSSPSVFNYYSSGYTIPNSGGLKAPEMQLYNPNNSILRENMVATLLSSYQNPVITNGPGTTIDLTPFVSLATTPATLVDAIDLTLTHGTMPSPMKQTIVTAVAADTGGNLRRVETAIYLTLQSAYYNVWH
jgi:uncharacterized protein (DUF1800 family)